MQYLDFHTGLNAGIDKIIDYYERSADSDAYIMAMRTILINMLPDLELTF